MNRREEAAILHAVASAKYPRLELPTIAHHHSTTLDTVQALCNRYGYPDKGRMLAAARRLLQAPDDTTEPEEPATEEQVKTCTSCEETKPLSEFYSSNETRDKHASQCRSCNNRRRPTEIRLLRNRARNRAYQLLVKAHPTEYARLYDSEYEKARVEHEKLAAQAAAAGNPDAATARLKPGPRRKDQVDVSERLDVARCPSCRTHHDADHACPNCGDTTPAQPPKVRPFDVRLWATAQGIPVPSRGPLPARVIEAYDAAHPTERGAVS